MKIIDLLNKIANGEVPKKIKVNDKFTYIHDGIDYKCAEGTYLFDAYIATKTEDMNLKVEILDDEEKELPEKIRHDACWIYDDETNQLEKITLKDDLILNKLDEIIDYLEKQRKGE